MSTAPVTFAAGRTTLGPKGKSQLDDLVSKLAKEKGYIIEVQGYSRGGLQTSQLMADSVVRYLVTEHQVPLYRIYRTGLGKSPQKPVDGERAITNGVLVSLMHNSPRNHEFECVSELTIELPGWSEQSYLGPVGADGTATVSTWSSPVRSENNIAGRSPYKSAPGDRLS